MSFKKLEKDFVKKEKAFREAKAKLLAYYESQNEETLEGNFLKIFKARAYVRKTVDSKILEKKFNNIYKKVLKSIPVKETVKIKQR